LIAGGPWREPTYADSTLGDVVDGEDLLVRRAAVDALGPYNGSVVVADPQTGRILTIVNQKLALGSGFQPCSTVKIVTAIAGLKEGIIERNTQLRLGRRSTMNLTDALAHSNNPFFARVGTDLGFERVHSYAKLLGLGEKAGLNIEGEFPGVLTPEPPKFGGVGMMTSFGEGIQLTALQLAALLSAIANGGTLYHLQYPRTKEEIANFAPRVKRHLDIRDQIPDVKPGMMAAVDYGTGRRANYDPSEPILGKTGTCTDRATPTHLGWFGSFNEVGRNKLVVVVLLTGGRPVNGPVAAEVAGSVYRNLSSQQFFAVAAQ
jgi:cell division protein FtsI/penicillin-binding protein 2